MNVEEIGARLREVRKARGMTLQDVADELGIHRQSVSTNETRGISSLKTLSAVLAVYGLRPVVSFVDKDADGTYDKSRRVVADQLGIATATVQLASAQMDRLREVVTDMLDDE